MQQPSSYLSFATAVRHNDIVKFTIAREMEDRSHDLLEKVLRDTKQD